MQSKRFTPIAILLSLVGFLALALLAAALWLSPARGAQAVSTPPILSSDYDVWQYGTWDQIAASGLIPMSGGVQITDMFPTSSTLLFVGTAPLTATVTTARIMLLRDASSDASGNVELGVCEGKDVVRVISAAPVAVDTDPELIWLDVPLVPSIEARTVAPSEYLCMPVAKTSSGTLFAYSVLQAAVRYWSPPTDQLYLPAIAQ